MPSKTEPMTPVAPSTRRAGRAGRAGPVQGHQVGHGSRGAVTGPDRTGSLAATVSRWPVSAATLVGASGLLVQAAAYSLGWSDREAGGLVLWYVGYALIIAPFAALLLGEVRSDHQRLAGSLNFTLLMYSSWLLSDPVMSTRFDESLHVTTLVDLVGGDGFFAANSMLPVSPHYPGLELATAGVHWLTGLPLFACQVLVVLTARVTLVLALFLLTSRIGRSTRVGAIAVLLYAASAQFYFFNAQFSYQTVAIAMLMAALYLLVRAFDSPLEMPWRPLLGVQVCLAALAITHHLTSWLVLVAIWVLVVLFAIGHERRRFRLTLITAELATLVVAGWTALITPLLLNYLGPIFSSAGDEIRSILSDGGERTIGSDTGGVPTPHWELLSIAGSILLWVLLLMPSCWAAWRRSSLGASRARYLPLVLAASYPFLQLTRFSSSAAEIGDRASTFVTMAMALIVAVWLAPRLQRGRAFVVPGAILLILGGTILGAGPDWQRMTGPYIAGAEQRSVDSETYAVAQWAGKYIPAGSKIAADSTVSRVLPNFAPVVPVNGGVCNVTELFISTSIDRSQQQLVQDCGVDFVFVDTRFVGKTVRTGSFFPGSGGFGPTAETITAPQVDKFQGAEGFDLVLDGPIRVYDVRGLRGARSTFADRAAPGMPGSWTPWQVGLTGIAVGVAVLVRRRLLDPRRFRAGDFWRSAVILPAAMAIGIAGVALGFPRAVGSGVLVLLVAGLVVSTRRAPLVPPKLGVAPWQTTAATAAVLVVAGAIAFLSAYDSLTGHAPLPPPPSVAAQVGTSIP